MFWQICCLTYPLSKGIFVFVMPRISWLYFVKGRHMSKSDRLENYPLFFEEIGPDRNNQSNDSDYQDRYETVAALSEDQLSALSEDLQSPINTSSQSSNPLR